MSEGPLDPSQAQSRRAVRVIGALLAVVAGLLALAGAILLAIPESPVTFGWFAYAPLSSTSFVPAPWLSSPRYCFGAVLLIVGIGAMLLCLGWWVGRRSRSRVAQ